MCRPAALLRQLTAVILSVACLLVQTVEGQDAPAELKSISVAAHERTIRGIAFARDSQSVWTASEDGTTRQWHVSERKLLRQLGEAEPLMSGVVVSRGGNTVATGGRSVIGLWDAQSGEQKLRIDPGQCVVVMDLSPDGRHVAAGLMLTDYAAVWDTASGKQVATLKEPAVPGETDEPSNGRAMGAVAFSPDGQYLAVCNAPPNFMSILSLYDARTFALRARFVAHTADRSYCLAFSPDGKLLACGTQDGQVKMFEVVAVVAAWDERAKAAAAKDAKVAAAVRELVTQLGSDDFNRREATNRELIKLGPQAIEPLKKLIDATSDAEIRLRAQAIVKQLAEAVEGPLKGLVPMHTLNVPRIGSVRSLAFSSDGSLLAIGSTRLGTSQGQLELWQLDNPQQPWRVVKDQPVNWLAISPDGKWVASGLTGGSLLLTEVRK
jgi:FOG: WD40 repeat